MGSLEFLFVRIVESERSGFFVPEKSVVSAAVYAEIQTNIFVSISGILLHPERL